MQINLNRHRSILRLAVPALAILLGMGANSAMAQKHVHKSIFRVYVGMPPKGVTENQLAREISRQLSGGGVSASEQEVQAAARRTLYLIGHAKDPQKGVIYISTKKFTLRASWGKDTELRESRR